VGITDIGQWMGQLLRPMFVHYFTFIYQCIARPTVSGIAMQVAQGAYAPPVKKIQYSDICVKPSGRTDILSSRLNRALVIVQINPAHSVHIIITLFLTY